MFFSGGTELTQAVPRSVYGLGLSWTHISLHRDQFGMGVRGVHSGVNVSHSMMQSSSVSFTTRSTKLNKSLKSAPVYQALVTPKTENSLW